MSRAGEALLSCNNCTLPDYSSETLLCHALMLPRRGAIRRLKENRRDFRIDEIRR
jgi:hypothetical protein